MTSEPREGLSGCRILVVEDTWIVAETITDLLHEYECEVIGPVARLANALPCAKREKIDAALLDVNLAGEFCFPVASILATRDIPFAFLTGYGDGAIPAEFHDAPRLGKPFHPRELKQLLCGMVRRIS